LLAHFAAHLVCSRCLLACFLGCVGLARAFSQQISQALQMPLCPILEGEEMSYDVRDDDEEEDEAHFVGKVELTHFYNVLHTTTHISEQTCSREMCLKGYNYGLLRVNMW
jgi:hypothetical protein